MSSKAKAKIVVGAPEVGSDGDGADPMADMMKKILEQEVVNSSAAPVLSKRKTEIMKSIEEEKDIRKKQRLSKQEKKANDERQLVVPDISTMNYEKTLKKIATRGVVSLFNAIAKAKRADIEENGENNDSSISKTKSSNKNKSKVDVQALSRDNFVKLLQKDKSINNSNNNNNSNSTTTSSSGKGPISFSFKVSGDSISSSISNSIKNGIKATTSSSSSNAGSSWSVVQDKGVLEPKASTKTKKGWDEDNSDDDGSDGEKASFVRFKGRGKYDGADDSADLFKEVGDDDEGGLKMSSTSSSASKSKSSHSQKKTGGRR